jgi:DNA polymerase-1
MPKKRLVVIDGKSVFYRGYYAMPNLSTKDGTPTGGVYGFTVMVLEVLKKMNPDFVAVAWDKPKTNIRRRLEIYPLYKANRKPAPPDFYEQIPLLHEVLEALKWPFLEIDDHEADDIMATLCRQAKEKGYETILITSDHDVLQTIDDSTTVAILKKGLTNVEMYDANLFRERYKMEPEQFIDYKSLRGDTSDNIPGVAGVGEKTAAQLISDHKTLDGVYENIDLIKNTLKAKLVADKDKAYIAKQLVTLDDHVDIELDWERADVTNLDAKKLNQVLRDFEFRTLANQLPPHLKVDPSEIESAGSEVDFGALKIDKITDSKQLHELKFKELVLVHVWCAGSHGKDIKKLIISDSPKQCYLLDVEVLGLDDVTKFLRTTFDGTRKLIAHNSKLVLKALIGLGVESPVIETDIRMTAFLLNSLIREQSLSELARNELGYDDNDLDDVTLEEFDSRATKIIAVLWQLYERQAESLKKLPEVARLAKQIEWPVTTVLAKMELEGIILDTKYLAKMSQKLEGDISDVQQTIYGMAGMEFNISSPSQMAEVLFDKLGLPTVGIKKGKTGYSTAAKELDKLRSQHEIINEITKYREYTKLKSTYVDSLPKLVDEDSRLHTTFSTAVAPSGRLSSHDPNLQNIPTRTDLGREIRTAFVAAPGKTFVSADYSQFELRLAAVLAGDDELIESFNDGLDVHTRTAAQVYGVALEDVTKTQRRDAKVINFGILYGMSPHGLSNATGMTQKDAKDFIDRYFELRAPILTYIDKLKAQAKDDGFVETMFGRRRPTPDVKSSNFVVRQAAERAAVNHPIQGTEADLMKMAMIKIDEQLPQGAKQVLQIHDSILVECDESQAEEVGKMCKEVMENIYKLPVNLDVDVSAGKNWGEL